MPKIIHLSPDTSRKRTPGKRTSISRKLLSLPLRMMLAMLLPAVSLLAGTCGLLASGVSRLTGAFPVDLRITISSDS